LKKVITLLAVLLLLSGPVFSAESAFAFLVETNSGYAFGKDMSDNVPINLKLSYIYSFLGFTLEAGTLRDENTPVHFYLGPTLYLLNTPNFRVSFSTGFDYVTNFEVPKKYGEKPAGYTGIGGMLSFNYSLSKYVYVGLNLEANYYWVMHMKAYVGDAESLQNTTDSSGTPVIMLLKTPIYDDVNRKGKYFQIKPLLSVGIQY
jgi:hypothetical protein